MRNHRDQNLASTTVADMKAVAQDMLRMGKHWTQAAQDWLDQRRDEARDSAGPRRARRGPHSDYGAGGYGQVDDGPRASPYGARGYRGVGPRNYTRSDERIREDLNERLTEADDLDASGISVEVNNGVATLTGSVVHRWMKHRAEDLADDCIGVRDVRNQIVVRTAAGSGGSAAAGTGAGTGTVGAAATGQREAAATERPSTQD